jgi:type IV pilus assembly protein PilX
VLLIMLVVVTLLALSTVRSTTMDERMAGNARDRERAFQATEAAVRACLNLVKSNTYPTGDYLTPALATDADTTQQWDRSSVWAAVGGNSQEITVGDATLASQPRCIVENLGSGSFRVTGKGVGGSSNTVVMLQATYSPE